jgi:hypothetical protein
MEPEHSGEVPLYPYKVMLEHRTNNFPSRRGARVFVASEQDSSDSIAANAGFPGSVREAIARFAPSRYRGWIDRYVERCVAELGCTAEVGGGKREDYLNVFPPARCRRARVSGVTYSSGRTAVYTGPIPLDRFNLAQQTCNSGKYAYPKLPHLDSEAAVNEAIELTKIAIDRLEKDEGPALDRSRHASFARPRRSPRVLRCP